MTDPLEEYDDINFTIKLMLFGVAVLMAVAGWTCFELGRVNGYDEGYQDGWSHIPIELRPSAPLNLEET